jgi:hypothetical protein
MNRTIARTMIAILSTLATVALGVGPALAHGHTTVGKYELVIGFKNEPAYQGEPNGLDLAVTNTETKAPVTGLEDTLKAELIFGASRRELKVVPQWGKDGHYTANVLPTADGDYTWHITGTIEGTPVDISMTSGEGTFGAVQSKASVSFPAADPTSAELRDQVAAAQQAAQNALVIGGLGALFGLIGLALAALSLRSARRTQPAPTMTQRQA